MIQERTPRKRQFEQIRQGGRLDKSVSTRNPPNQTHNLSPSPRYHQYSPLARQSSHTPLRKSKYNDHSTATKSPIKTPTRNLKTTHFDDSPQFKTHSEFNHSNLNRTSEKTKRCLNTETIHKSSQRLKGCQYCVDCTNRYLTKHRKEQQRAANQIQERKTSRMDAITKQNQLNMERMERERREKQKEHGIEINKRLREQKQMMRRKEAQKKREEDRRYNEEVEEAKKMAKIQSQSNVKKNEKHKEYLLDQMMEEKERKRKEADYLKNLGVPKEEYQRMDHLEKQARATKDKKHQEQLLRQIQEKRYRENREKEVIKKINQANDMMMRMGFIDPKEVQSKKIKQHQKLLQKQIQQNQRERQDRRQREKKEKTEYYQRLKQESLEQQHFDSALKTQKVNRYYSDLKKQIDNNQTKRLLDKEREKREMVETFEVYEKPLGAECDGCHKSFPPRFLCAIEEI